VKAVPAKNFTETRKLMDNAFASNSTTNLASSFCFKLTDERAEDPGMLFQSR
jgi:hypothetical protein